MAGVGGSNGHRVRLWDVELAELAKETAVKVTEDELAVVPLARHRDRLSFG
jgi:hypothetical protein